MDMNQKLIKKISLYLSLFILGSWIGFVHENILNIIKGQPELRQGLIYEPLIPIYGIGLLLFYIVFEKIGFSISKVRVFFVSFIIGGLFEYGCSFVQEKLFGTISWDYSYLLLNFNGRTSVFHACCWGIAGVLFYNMLPKLQIKNHLFNHPALRRVVFCMSFLVFCDCFISTLACYRQEARRMNQAPSNGIEVFLDEHFPDERLNMIFNNAKRVEQK